MFETIKSTFLEVEEFGAFNENMSTIAGQMLSNMSHALQFDFTAYDPSNYFKTLRVHPSEDGETRAYEELGTGQQQILALSFAHAYAKSFLGQGLIFILDEPEAHLDNKLVADYLVGLVKQKQFDRQIIFASHNSNFVINGDSALIHILEIPNNDVYTRKTSTTIENIDNREKLLKLEGGREAFLNRESKYGI